MRVVLDTNVLIAAFIAHGVCNELLEHCALNHQMVTSEFILDEFEGKLLRKFDYSVQESHRASRLLKSRSILVVPTKLTSPISRDPDDDMIIGTAVAGDCDCIVTGDKDLLVLKSFSGIRIISPSAFWEFEQK